jgi:acetyltransferase-like isoleucine patch superfamily enzyme
MNWVGDLIQKEVGKNDTVIELGCGIMQGTMDTLPTSKTKLKCKSISGMDVHQEYLDFLSKRGIETFQHDLTKTPLPLAEKSYDVVLLIDILEHLPSLRNAETLLNEVDRIARKKAIVFTPTHFRTVNPETDSWNNLGFSTNEHQRHLILITKEMLIQHGYHVKNIIDKIGLHHLYAVKVFEPTYLQRKKNSFLEQVFEYGMDNWRRKHHILFEDGSYNGNVTIGKNTYISHLAVLNPTKDYPIKIGDDCSVKEFCNFHGNLKIGNKVRIATHNVIITTRHSYEDPNTPIYLQPTESKGVIIEDDVWLGAGCIILDGCKIGKGSVLGAGTLIPQDTEIPAGSVVVGNPYKIIKQRGVTK